MEVWDPDFVTSSVWLGVSIQSMSAASCGCLGTGTGYARGPHIPYLETVLIIFIIMLRLEGLGLRVMIIGAFHLKL